MIQAILTLAEIEEVNKTFNTDLIGFKLQKLTLTKTILLIRNEVVMGALPISVANLVNDLEEVSNVVAVGVVFDDDNTYNESCGNRFKKHASYINREKYISLEANGLPKNEDMGDMVLDPYDIDSTMTLGGMCKRYGMLDDDIRSSLDLMVSLNPNVSSDIGDVYLDNGGVLCASLELGLKSVLFCISDLITKGKRLTLKASIDFKIMTDV